MSAAVRTVDEVALARVEARRAKLLKRYERKQVSSVQLTLQLSMLEKDADVLLGRLAPKKPEPCQDCGDRGYEVDADGEADCCSTCHGAARLRAMGVGR